MIRAAVFDGPGRPFRFETLPRPHLGPGEALLRVRLCTICGSDLHTFSGRRHGPTPCVLGHEILGIAEAIGDRFADAGGEPVQVGDRVVVGVAGSCGACFFCQRGLPQKCESLFKYGHQPVTAGRGPLGGLATHCHLLPGSTVVKVPDDVPDSIAAPAGCATATVAAALAVANALRTPSGSERVLVILGLGMLGLTACAMASAAGATVIGCDLVEERMSLARRFGATYTATPAEVQKLARSLTVGRGADLCLEMSGATAAAALSVDVLRVGGTAIWAGAVAPTEPVPVNPEAVVRKCLTVAGLHNYTPQDLRFAVRFLAAAHARFPFTELVARVFALDEVDDAFRSAAADRPVRVAIMC
jgi:alcohol dehydrogenase